MGLWDKVVVMVPFNRDLIWDEVIVEAVVNDE
jgi:hypothetical protein